MIQSTTPPAGGPSPHPVLALREHLAQTAAAATQLRSLLAVVEDPGRRPGASR